MRTALGLDENRNGWYYGARIDTLKGHQTLIEALALLHKEGTTVTMLIVGDGAERAQTSKVRREH